MKVNLGFVKADLRLYLDEDGGKHYAYVEVTGQVRVIGKGWVKFHAKKRLFRVLLVDHLIQTPNISTTNTTISGTAMSIYKNPTGVPTS